MNLLCLLKVLLCESLVKIKSPPGKLDQLKSVVVNALFEEDTNSTIHVSHDGRELEFEEKEVDSVQKVMVFLKIYSAPKIDSSSFANLMKIHEENEEELIKNGRISFAILFVDEKSVEKLKEINGIKVFLSTDKKLAEELNTPFPGVFGYNHEDRVVYQLKVNDDYEKVTYTVRKPLFDIITNQNARLYESSELPTFYLLCKEEEYNSFKENYLPVVYSLRNEIQFCLMKYSPMINIKSFGITEEDLPAVISVKETKKYSSKKLTKESLMQFYNEYKENSLKEFFLSQDELPENDTLSVKRITYNSNEKYVKDSSKDRFIVFEAPWCKFCQMLKPVLGKLGEFYSESDKILIGTYDMTENEPLNDFSVKGYPSLYFIKGETNEIVQYTKKERDILSLAEFIKNEGTFKIDITEKVKEYVESEAKKEEELKEKKEEVKEEIDDFNELNDDEISELLNGELSDEFSEEDFRQEL